MALPTPISISTETSTTSKMSSTTKPRPTLTVPLLTLPNINATLTPPATPSHLHLDFFTTAPATTTTSRKSSLSKDLPTLFPSPTSSSFSRDTRLFGPFKKSSLSLHLWPHDSAANPEQATSPTSAVSPTTVASILEGDEDPDGKPKAKSRRKTKKDASFSSSSPASADSRQGILERSRRKLGLTRKRESRDDFGNRWSRIYLSSGGSGSAGGRWSATTTPVPLLELNLRPPSPLPQLFTAPELVEVDVISRAAAVAASVRSLGGETIPSQAPSRRGSVGMLSFRGALPSTPSRLGEISWPMRFLPDGDTTGADDLSMCRWSSTLQEAPPVAMRMRMDDAASLDAAELQERADIIARNRKHRCTEFNGLGYLGLRDSQTTIRYVDMPPSPLTGVGSQDIEKKQCGDGQVQMAWLTGRTRWLSGLRNIIRPYRRRNNRDKKVPVGDTENVKNKRKAIESVATENRSLLCDTPQ